MRLSIIDEPILTVHRRHPQLDLLCHAFFPCHRRESTYEAHGHIRRHPADFSASASPQQAYKDFLPTILQTFGKSKLTTYLVRRHHKTPVETSDTHSSEQTALQLQSPCFFLGFLATLGFGWSAGHFKENTLHIVSES